MSSRRDIDLVIRAKDEASKAFERAGAAIESLVNLNSKAGSSATGAGSKFEQMANAVLSLDKAMAQASGRYDAATQGLARQASQISAYNGRLTSLRSQMDSATKAAERLQAAIVQQTLDGGNTAPLVMKLQAVQSEMAALEGETRKVERSLSTAQSSYTQNAAALTDVETGLRSLGAASTFARAEADQVTRSLEAQQRVARQTASVLQTVNRTTGVTRDRGDYDQLVAQIQAAADAEEARTVKLEAEAAAIAKATAAQREFNSLLDAASGKSARSSASVFIENGPTDFEKQAEAMRLAEAAAKAEANEIARLKAELNPLPVIEAKLAAETEKLTRWQKQGEISAEEQAQALKLLRQEADRASKTLARRNGTNFLGLEPYQLQNLSFQINDVFTQIASGTSVTQTLAQQGGQIIQIFPRAGAAIVRALTSAPVLAMVAAVGTLIVAIRDAASEAEKLRAIEGVLTASADGTSHNAATIVAAAQALDRYGLSAEDALKSVRTFLKEGVDDRRMEEFGKAAADTARVLGVDATQAAEDVAKAFTGGFEAVRKLDDALGFLTAAQREQIKALFDEGRAAEARNMALGIYSKKMDEAAAKMRGPWSDAARELGNAWSEFLDLISNSKPIQSFGDALAQLGKDAAQAIRDIRGAATAGDLQRQLQAAQDMVASIEKQLADANPLTRGGLEANLRVYKEQVSDLTKQIEALGKAGAATGDPLHIDPQKATNATKALQAATAAAKEFKDQTLEQVRATALDKANRYLDENFKIASEVAKAEYRRQEIAEATAKWIKAQADEAKRLANERESEIQKFNSRVIGAEGGAADNPFSSATGFGQFIKGTWLEQFRKVFADEAAKLSQDQILALRQNATVAKAVIDNYARENAKFLESFGAKVTAGNLYLTHFLGAAGAKAVLTAPGNKPVDQLLPADVIKANKGYLTTNGRARTASELQTFIAGRIGDTGAQQTAGQQAIAKLESDRLEKQAKFNLAVQQENDERQRNIAALTEQNSLQDTALLAAQKKAAVDKAEAELRDKIARVNENLKPGQELLNLTEEQIQKTRELAAAEFDLQNARNQTQARLNEVQRPVDDLAARRDALRQQIETYRDLGNFSLAESLTPQLESVNSELIKALERLKAFYAGLTDLEKVQLGITSDGIAAITTQIEIAQQKSFEWLTFMGISGQTIAQQFSQGAASAIDSFAEAIAGGANAFSSLWDAFRQFAANFLRQIAQMIEQQIIFNLVSGLFSAGASAGGANVTGSTGAFAGVKAHSGGVIGDPSTYRGQTGVVDVSPAWFQNAMRYHSGGIAGLKPDEVPAILQRGEEVITRADARHRDNGGGGSGQQPKINIVNTLDPGEFVSKGLGSRAGEQSILNFIRDNSAAVKQALG
ncbi:phage tail length tape measure family protein [Novosphingobium mathurense]|uniref:Prophage tail length tape measure protein n=1 Tax=Novosphingobium mathurense TaxID=428990 RepID=A0A1U6GY39_9SPHN|nr:phage tail length tape measure family protein [Novosphingobium mathurense]SLJ88406.1 Prophage tail length tape measure protein [Novosphingobium mathurense]